MRNISIDKSVTKRVIEIAINFEDALRFQGQEKENILFPASDIYFLLCCVMPDPSKIVWSKNE